MRFPLAAALLLLATAVSPAEPVAGKITVTVANDLDIPRPSETIAVSWDEIARLLPGAEPDHILVKDVRGSVLASQFTNFNPDAKPAHYDELLFQHSFAAGEKRAVFTIEATREPVPPFPSKVFARYVPERLDDFAWENDRIAHRIYGPGLDTEAAGKSRMVSSGIDVWCKRVSWLVVDRWYLRGHDAYHKDSGEGLDLYEVGPSRGCGGTGIWDGKKLHVSRNWKSWKVLANGPLRTVFELAYDPWDAGGVMVSETKRFTVDAGQFLDRVESTFEFKSDAGELTAALGVGKHKKVARAQVSRGEHGEWLSLWEDYGANGQLGTAVVHVPGGSREHAEDELNHLLLVNVKPGRPVTYFAGAGWSKQGEIKTKESWNAYLAACAKRAASPLKIEKIEAR